MVDGYSENEIKYFNSKIFKRKLFESLCRYNYLPNQKKGSTEIPSFLTSKRFTPEIAEMLCSIYDKIGKRGGFDVVDYSATRHNNISRRLSIPHPLPYSMLVKTIIDNWEEMSHITTNNSSIIKPDILDDKRVIIMNYEDKEETTSRELKLSFSKNFLVKTDISSCFSSIYTHSIPWAAVGIKASKKTKNKKELWYNKLDLHQRHTKRNETNGIPIGPATSNIIVELILGSIDKKLSSKGYTFIRYIDDYYYYASSTKEVDEFINLLEKELKQFKLSLNIHKTSISELPCPIVESWISNLLSQMPSIIKYTTEEDEEIKEYIPAFQVIRFISNAAGLKKSTPDGSTIKYAISLIESYIDDDEVDKVIPAFLNLCWHYPVILPHLEKLLDKSSDKKSYRLSLDRIIIKSAKKNQSDGMSWSIYYLSKYRLPISSEASNQAFQTKDCITLLCLYLHGTKQKQIIDFLDKIPKDDVYTLDEYWILIYELFFRDIIQNPYNDGCFEILKKNNVSFALENLENKKNTEAEDKCELVEIDLSPKT